MAPLRQSLRAIASKLKVPVDVIEKDYALSHVLAAIYQNETLDSTLVFKGGTALRKAYFAEYRFSVDLDFTAVGGPRGMELDEAISAVARATKDLLRERGPFDVSWSRRPEKSPHPTGQEAFRMQVRFPWQSGALCVIKIEITTDEPVLLPPVRRELLHVYDESVRTELLTYPIEEIVAEKLRTPAQAMKRVDEGKWARNCARDYHDLWYLFSLPGDAFDPAIAASILSRKCDIRDVRVDAIDDVFPVAIVSEAERQWESSLADLVRPLPAFDLAMEELRARLKAFSFGR